MIAGAELRVREKISGRGRVWLLALMLPLIAAADDATLVQIIDSSQFDPPSPDSTGGAYIEHSGTLLITDSEVNEMAIFEGVNQFEINTAGTLLNTFSSLAWSTEPTGVAYNSVNQHLFYSDDNRSEIYEVEAGSDGAFGTPDDVFSEIDTTPFGSNDPEGIAFDSELQVIYIAEGVGSEVYRVESGANGVFDGVPPAGDDLVTNFDTAALGVTDPEGIDFDPVGRQLYIIGSPSNRVAQVTTSGLLVRHIDLPVAHVDPGGLTLAPGSVDPTVLNLWIADRGIDNNDDSNENDGKIYEYILPAITTGNAAPVVSAGPDQSLVLPNTLVLDGTVTDDDLPAPPSLVATWSQVSGPGTTTFADSSAVDTTANISLPGEYVLRLTVFDGELQTSDDVAISASGSSGTIVYEARISNSADDAEESAGGAPGLTSSDLEIVTDASVQTIGLRYPGVDVPHGATITSAFLQFQVDETTNVATNLVIESDASDDAANFTTAFGNISSRTRTTSSITWSPPAWNTVNEQDLDQRTPDLSAIIQEVVDRSGWGSGQALAFIITGSGERVAESFDGTQAAAALLHIEYAGSPGNTPPIVSAGTDQVITLPADAALNGSATDDGIPSPPSLLVTWSYVSGPGSVVFADAASAATTVNFSAAGTYVLRLTATDGELRSSDEVTIVANGVGGVASLDVRVAAGGDDAEENTTGGINLTSSDLELVADGNAQTVGIRFVGVTIPQGATVSNAFVQFQVDEATSGATALLVEGEAIDSSSPFSTTNSDISSRARTTAGVPWIPPAWNNVGAAGVDQRTPDIGVIIEEIVQRPGWSSGNALTLVVSGTGSRVAESFNGTSAAAALLHVEYAEGGPTNDAPVATAVDASGTAVVGETLTGSYAYFDNDGDPEGTSTFRWLTDSGVISGETTTTYVIQPGDVGENIRFEVTPVASAGELQGLPVQSTPIGPVQAVNSAPVASLVGITGNAFEGETLIGDYSYSDVDGDLEDVSTFRWLTDSGAIPGATSQSYLLATGDIGENIRFEVTPVAASGELLGTPVASLPLGPVQAPNSAPVADNVSISGLPVEGGTLVGDYDFDDTDGDLEGVSTYRWLTDSGVIAGADSQSYVLGPVDVGENIRFEVTPVALTGVLVGTPAASSPVGPVQVPNTPPVATAVSIAGVAIEGERLTGSYGYSDVDGDLEGVSTFQWFTDSGPIPGANTRDYDLTGTDIGENIRFEVTPVAMTGELIGSPVASSPLGPVAPIGANTPPTVAAGDDQAITLPAGAVLDGTVSDDGIPSPASLTTTWSQVSGPGVVTFSDASAVDTTASFSLAGSYVLRLTANDGAAQTSDDVTIDVDSPAVVTTLDVRVSASTDDAEQQVSGGNASLTSSDLEMVFDGGDQTIGLRFTNLTIPQGANILNAHVQFQVDEVSTTPTSLTLRAQATDNAGTFGQGAADILSRGTTSASVQWSPSAWSTVGEAGPAQQSPDIAALIQEVVDRGGWTSSNSLAVIISGTGERVAESFNGDSTGAALLHIEFEGGSGNTPPLVSAGPDQSVTLPDAALLNGSVSDDGLPAPSTISTSWSQVSGPGTVVFSDDSALVTSATFSASGAYVLRLSASDGLLQSSADVTVTVNPAPGTGVFEVRVAASTDDAEERPTGNIALTSSDLELVQDGNAQTVGMRFNGLTIPQGATILNAFVQFQVDETSTVATSLSLQGEASDNAITFAGTNSNISSRPRTAAAVPWNPPAWSTVGQAGPEQRTPDLAPVVQEIVDRTGWSNGNSLVFIVTGTGSRVAESFNGAAAAAALLRIEYQE